MSEVNSLKGKRIFLNDEVYLIEEKRSITNSNSGVEAIFSCPEVTIIKELVMASGKPLSRQYLLDNCWGGRIVTNTSLSVAINKIRERLNSVGLDDAILTIPRYGYQINLTDDERLEVEPLFYADTISDISSEEKSINVDINIGKKDRRRYEKIRIKLSLDHLVFFMSWMFSISIFSIYLFG
ncbi:winged helix-turn-helix domain-containing protein [Photobacterium makurazakiensis]|uniref:winged helix-turn-helix domain-containing protein n=1 Tax=Photobacterium makurazakiensis TaxID=2910234 RepID=UPI003D10B6D7